MTTEWSKANWKYCDEHAEKKIMEQLRSIKEVRNKIVGEHMPNHCGSLNFRNICILPRISFLSKVFEPIHLASFIASLRINF